MNRMRTAASVAGAVWMFSATALAQTTTGIEPDAGRWKTWVLRSGSELRLPAPGDAAGELIWLKGLVATRDAESERQVRYWDAGSPSYRWIEMAMAAMERSPLSNPRGTRFLSMLNVAVYDAMVTAWDSKYTYGRPRPSVADAGIAPIVTVPNSPSYPSEHAVAAGAASTILGAIYPADKAHFDALAEEAARSRLYAGVQYPSDVTAGLELGRAVARRVLDRAATDGSAEPWTGTVPTGPGLWRGTNPAEPRHGEWKTWVLTSGNQFRPAPPPAFDSAQMAAEMEEIKSYPRTFNSNAKAFYYHTVEGVFGYWYQLAHNRLFELNLDHNAPRSAQAYALMSITQYDSSVACWEAKYTYWSMRPIMIDTTFTSVFPTPNHPSYPAGHGCYSGGIGRMVEYLFPDTQGFVDRKATEAAESRFWGGIHFRSDLTSGLNIGRQVAEAVWKAK